MSISIIRDINTRLINIDLVKKGEVFWYGTCSDEVLDHFRRAGWTVEVEVNNGRVRFSYEQSRVPTISR